MKIKVNCGKKRFCLLFGDRLVPLQVLWTRGSGTKITPLWRVLEERKIAPQFPLSNIVEMNLVKKVSQFIHREIGDSPAVLLQGLGNQLLICWLHA